MYNYSETQCHTIIIVETKKGKYINIEPSYFHFIQMPL